jgi:hypothetical protein
MNASGIDGGLEKNGGIDGGFEKKGVCKRMTQNINLII